MLEARDDSQYSPLHRLNACLLKDAIQLAGERDSLKQQLAETQQQLWEEKQKRDAVCTR